MSRTAKSLVSAMLVMAVSIFAARAGSSAPAGHLKPNLDPPSYCDISVLGVEMRSSCDLPEWWVQARNTSTSNYYIVSIHARTKASVGNDALCTEDVTREFELDPGQCERVYRPFFNSTEHPCDDSCCFVPPQERDSVCVLCTRIIAAEVKIIASRPDSSSAWEYMPEPPTTCAIANGARAGGDCSGCRVINTCAIRNWSFSPCQELGTRIEEWDRSATSRRTHKMKRYGLRSVGR